MNNDTPRPVPLDRDLDSHEPRGLFIDEIDAACTAWLRARGLRSDSEMANDNRLHAVSLKAKKERENHQ